MNAKEQYVKETGDKAPNHQAAYHEWFNRYVKWLEKKIEEIYIRL